MEGHSHAPLLSSYYKIRILGYHIENDVDEIYVLSAPTSLLIENTEKVGYLMIIMNMY